ncbi:MAG: hypothetical protein KatS3mg131_3817 [Candidatus Tectimicrobiota bacterium]|nr:MAG: hypothetical protein KatS3mg131_3817 [Candidatus Tectomicrobia bacterium]
MARDFGQKTLLLEGDFKRPVLTRYLKTELQAGLVDLLVNQPAARSSLVPFADIVIPFADDNLAVLPAVRRVRNSSGLLNSQQMRDLLAVLRTQYDYILIDAAPVLPLSDMAIFEEVVDGVVLVVRAEKTPRAAVSDAVQTLAAGKLAGFVLNDVRQPVLLPYYRYSYEAA